MKRVNHQALTNFTVHAERIQPHTPNTLEQMFESVSEVLYRQRYGTERPQVSKAEQAPRSST
jgi:hypothetical protein